MQSPASADSIPQKIRKVFLIFFITILISFALNIILALVLNNPGGGGAEVVILFPAGWLSGLILWLIFITTSIKKINDNFLGKFTFPLLFAILLGYILLAMPIYTFSLATDIRNYF